MGENGEREGRRDGREGQGEDRRDGREGEGEVPPPMKDATGENVWWDVVVEDGVFLTEVVGRYRGFLYQQGKRVGDLLFNVVHKVRDGRRMVGRWRRRRCSSFTRGMGDICTG